MNVYTVVLKFVLLNKLNGGFDIGQSRMREVGRRNVQLFDPVLLILPKRAGILFARVDDGPDAFAPQGRHVTFERVRPDDHMTVDSVPPITDTEHTPEKDIPGERWPKDETGVESGKQGDGRSKFESEDKQPAVIVTDPIDNDNRRPNDLSFSVAVKSPRAPFVRMSPESHEVSKTG